MDVMDPKRIPFTPEDERKIASAGLWGLIVATTSIGVATLMVLAIVTSGSLMKDDGLELAITLAIPAGQIFLNVWLLQASVAFRKVALTDVADHAFLLRGFRRLRIYFLVQGVFFLLILSAFVVAACGLSVFG
jgi:hypothetical protein